MSTVTFGIQKEGKKMQKLSLQKHKKIVSGNTCNNRLQFVGGTAEIHKAMNFEILKYVFQNLSKSVIDTV